MSGKVVLSLTGQQATALLHFTRAEFDRQVAYGRLMGGAGGAEQALEALLDELSHGIRQASKASLGKEVSERLDLVEVLHRLESVETGEEVVLFSANGVELSMRETLAGDVMARFGREGRSADFEIAGRTPAEALKRLWAKVEKVGRQAECAALFIARYALTETDRVADEVEDEQEDS